jgi:hypothetical protein
VRGEESVFGRTWTWPLDIVAEPATREIWIGRPANRYVVVQRRVWGLRTSDTVLSVTRSQNPTDPSDSEQAIISRFLAAFFDMPTGQMWQGGSMTDCLDLRQVFGDVIFRQGYAGGAGPSNALRLVEAQFDQTGLRLKIHTQRGHDLSVTLNSDLQIRDAQKDGKAVLVLYDGQCTKGSRHGFLGPGGFRAATIGGTVELISPMRIYTRLGPDGQEHGLTSASAHVWPETGGLLVVPTACRIALAGQKMFGVRVESGGDLCVFVGPRARIPGVPDGPKVFAREMEKFADEFEARNYEWRPDLRLKIPTLFPGDDRFADGTDFWMSGKGVSVTDKGMVVHVAFCSTSGEAQITLSSELPVLATRVVSP